MKVIDLNFWTRYIAGISLIVINMLTVAYGQKDVQQYVVSNLSIISSLDSLHIGKNISSIRSAIGDANIVMLGEQSHGDGTTFTAKSQLVKYLHDSLGFNILAFESDFFALTSGWSKIQKDRKTLSSFLKYNIYPIWSFSQECSDLLYRYIPETYNTTNPLVLAGLDTQMHGSYTEDSLTTRLNSFFEINRNQLPNFRKYQSECTSLLDSVLMLNYKNKTYIDSILNTSFKNRIVSLATSFNEVCESISEQNQDEYLALKNIIIFINDLCLRNSKGGKDLRDNQMAENLKWIIQSKYPNEKIIVWAANTHIMRNALNSFQRPSSNMRTLGTAFTEDIMYSKKTYILGFTSSTGVSQTVMQHTPYKLKKAVDGFESWIPDTVQFGFVDFRKFESNKKNSEQYFVLRARGHSAIRAKWTNVFDGIFYIKNMYPAQFAK